MIVDAHTDVLWKMLKEPEIDFYAETQKLSVNYPNMIQGNVSLQFFAIFVSSLKSAKFTYVLQSIDDFYQKIEDQNKLNLATSFGQLETILKSNKKAAILSLEGVDALAGNLARLRILHRLGIRAVGLTWNYANEAADGVLEERGGGLTSFGIDLVKEMNRLGMMIDVSHLSEKGFWDVVEISDSPIMASHSNAKYICNHPRNLTDEQIKAIIKMHGIIGVTYVKQFVSDKEQPSIYDLLLHIKHIAELGGINNIGLGSDFDGGPMISELKDPTYIGNLIDALKSSFDIKQVDNVLGNNWLRYIKNVLK